MKKLFIALGIIFIGVVVVVSWPKTISAPTKTEVTQTPEETPAKLPSDISLIEEQKGHIDDLTIFWKAPIEDSRCPMGVQCIWAGEARVKVSIISGKKSETATMILGKGETIVGKYKISISAVTPYPKASQKTTQDKYLVTFHVTALDN